MQILCHQPFIGNCIYNLRILICKNFLVSILPVFGRGTDLREKHLLILELRVCSYRLLPNQDRLPGFCVHERADYFVFLPVFLHPDRL